jgi:7-cyano-7-deazaguanine synthase
LGREKAIVLVSGGMDSCVVAAIAAGDHDLALLHCTYGQRTAERERSAFEAIAAHYGVRQKMTADLSFLGRMGGSSLTDASIPVGNGESPEGQIPSTYVPFRNSLFLSVAVSWAEVLDVGKIFIGAVESDSAGYPDCRKAYYDAFNRLARLGTRSGTIAVETPLIEKRKEQIVRIGLELRAPLHLTWSCYVRGDVACGRCESCTLRLKGFREAGVADPIPYLTSG